MSKSLKRTLRDISSERVLEPSQRELGKHLADIVGQLHRQADSTFSGNTWVEVGWPGLGECLGKNIEALIKLAERWGAPPQWVEDQRAAYDAGALGQLQKQSHDHDQTSHEQARDSSAIFRMNTARRGLTSGSRTHQRA
jgi:hypothetical protein